MASFANGDPALTVNGQHAYLGCWPDEELLTGIVAKLAKLKELTVTAVPEAVRLRRRGNLTFAFNYGNEPWTAPVIGTLVLGEQAVGPQGVSIWRS